MQSLALVHESFLQSRRSGGEDMPVAFRTGFSHLSDVEIRSNPQGIDGLIDCSTCLPQVVDRKSEESSFTHHQLVLV